FSHFARLPTAQLEKADLNNLIADVVHAFAERHPEISLQFIADNRLPPVHIDREQIRRVITNLFDNSVAAFVDSQPEERNIIAKTSFDESLAVASVDISDTGPGIPDSDKARIFEPYFTTRDEGTGLGLAIVTSILSDHQAEIR